MGQETFLVCKIAVLIKCTLVEFMAKK